MKLKFSKFFSVFLFSISFLNLKTEAIYLDEFEYLDGLENQESEVKKYNEDYINSLEDIFYEDEDVELDFSKNKNQESKNLTHILNKIPDEKNVETNIPTKNKDLEVEFDGKFRIDFTGSSNTRFLNNKNGGLDSTLNLGKSTLDFNVGIRKGKLIFERPIVEGALNLRNRSTWGKPDLVGETTKTKIVEGDLSYGEHNHRIGIPIFYVRAFDLTFDLNALLNIENKPLHFLKFGSFPFELGRGISLGSAYAVTPDFITYDVSNMIQEFAPGIQLYGSFDENKKYSYKAYTGILKNLSSSFGDINENIRTNQYGMKYFPQRGFGVFNIVGALQLDFNLKKTKDSLIKTSPYLMVYHEGEGSIFQTGDATTELTTFGLDFSSSFKNIEFGIEFAKNFGVQNIKGFDKNTVAREQRKYSIGSTNYSSSVLTNSSVLYVNDTANGLDSKNKNALYFGPSDAQQNAINSVNASSKNNNKFIQYDPTGGNNYTYLMNSSDRFRDPYQNSLQGFMGVADLTFKFEKENSKPTELSFSAGYSSGDDNPNASLSSNGDFIKDSRYDGFIGIQEIYSGKKVKSAFLLSGAGGIPRALSIPGSEVDSTNPIEYPSKVSRFTNLAFLGTGITTNLNGSIYNFKLNPNLIYYAQATNAKIFDTNLVNKLGIDKLPSTLGVEANLFLEITNKNIDGFKIFGTITSFFPGSYYSTLKQIPLNKKQAAYMVAQEQNRVTKFENTLGNNVSLYANIGVEFSY